MTMKQKQALLAYLGYYNGLLDGLWGQQSQRATIDFQRPAIQRNRDGAIAKVKRFAQYV